MNTLTPPNKTIDNQYVSSLILRKIFKKDVDRTIKGVIQANEVADPESLKTELDEYVFTREIERYLGDFLDAYNDYHEERGNGVWISGFFGSGKSHLLKILSLVLENRPFADGKTPLEYVLPHVSVDAALLQAELTKAVDDFPSESILFNIDAKTDKMGKENDDAVLQGFLRAFNEHCGFCGTNPGVAKFECELAQEGIYAEFKQVYAEVTGKNWEADRKNTLFMDGKVAAVLSKLKGGEPSEFKGEFKSHIDNFHLSLEDFADQVREYIDARCKALGNSKFRLNFFVDEVGQYVAENTKLMLNLQTISEQLTTKCGAHSWLFVTAQDDMSTFLGSESKQQSNDFSKIQARFAIKLKLSSRDVAEVIEKRLLEKQDEAKPALKALYAVQKRNSALFAFQGGSTYQFFRDEDHFLYCYPFLPYQFELFQECIKGLSDNNAFTGRHSSTGERSMLDVFQQVVKALEEKHLGALASFDLMYEGIRSVLQPSSFDLISKAEKQLTSRDPFAVKLLKALLLVKYVKSFDATVENLVVLMSSDFDEKRSELKRKVELSLELMERESYVKRDGTLYSFLTNEEKDVENQINNMDVDPDSVNRYLDELFFGKILASRKIRDPEFKTDHPFMRLIDGVRNGRPEELGINLIFASSAGDVQLRYKDENQLLVVLPQSKLMDELYRHERTEKYLNQNQGGSGNSPTRIAIMTAKRAQNDRLQDTVVDLLKEQCAEAVLYVRGKEVSPSETDVRKRIEGAFLKLVSACYLQRYLVKDLVGIKESDLSTLLQIKADDALSSAEECVRNYLQIQKNRGITANVKKLITDFKAIPYGFEPVQVLAVIAKLYGHGKIEVQSADSASLSAAQLGRDLVNTARQEGLQISLTETITDSEIHELQNFLRDYFEITVNTPDPLELALRSAKEFAARSDEFEAVLADCGREGWILSSDEREGLQRVITLSSDISQKNKLVYKQLPPLAQKLQDDWDLFGKKLVQFYHNTNQREKLKKACSLWKSMGSNWDELLGVQELELGQTYRELGEALKKEPFYDGANVRAVRDAVLAFEAAEGRYQEALKNTLHDDVAGTEAVLRNEKDYAKLSENAKSQLDYFFNRKRSEIEAAGSCMQLHTLQTKFKDSLLNEALQELARLNVPENTPKPSEPSSLTATGTAQVADTAAVRPSSTVQVVAKPAIKKLAELKVPYAQAQVKTAEDVDEYLEKLRDTMLDAVKEGISVQVK